jgi:hypothetical protein
VQLAISLFELILAIGTLGIVWYYQPLCLYDTKSEEGE